VIDGIGDGIAVLQGTTERPGEQPLRQNNPDVILMAAKQPADFILMAASSRRMSS